MLADARSGRADVNDVVTHMIGTGLPFGGLGESAMDVSRTRGIRDVFTATGSVAPDELARHTVPLSAAKAFACRFETRAGLSVARLNLL